MNRWLPYVFVLLVPGLSYAALPAVVGTTLNDIQTDALAAIDLVWPVLLAVLAAFVVIKVVKRAASKV